MSTQADPLAEATPPDRLAYAPGVLLAADDLVAEQLYHRAGLARALAYLHGWGTIAGGEVARRLPPAGAGPDVDDEIVLEPGLVLDRIGRLIVVPKAQCIRMTRWFRAQPPASLNAGLFTVDGTSRVVVDLFLRFAPCPHGKTPALATGPFDATDALADSRLRDGFALDLVVRTVPAPPLPVDPWAGFPVAGQGADPAGDFRRAVYGSWRRDRDDLGALKRLPEHDPGQDPTSIFLARLLLFAAAGATPADAPILDPNRPVEVRDQGRRFVPPVGALARWAGIPTVAP